MAASRVLQSAFIGGMLLITGCGRSVIKSSVQEIATQKAKLAGKGWPVDPSELHALLKIDPNENAGPGVKAVLLTLVEEDGGFQGNPLTADYKPEIRALFREIPDLQKEVRDTGNAEAKAKLQKDIDQISPYLDELAKAVQKPKWDFDRKWEDGAAMLMPDLRMEKDLVRALAVRAYMKAISGQTEAALADLGSARKMSKLLTNDPGLIQILVSGAMETITAQMSFQIVRERPNDAALRKGLAELWSKANPTPNYKLAWSMEVLQFTSLLDKLWSKKAMDEIGLNGEQPISEAVVRETQAKLFTLYAESVEKWPADFSNVDKAIASLEPISIQIEDVATSSSTVLNKLSSGDGSPFCRSLEVMRRYEAGWRLLNVALALVSQGRIDGSYKLPSMAQEPKWLDPYSGKPFLLKNTSDGFILYSIGENKKDDGGDSARNGDYPPLDIVISFPKRVSGGI